MSSDLQFLASLLKSRNTVDGKIANIIGRPTHLQDVGEYIASAIFGLALDDSASHKGSSGRFTHGPLAGHSVDIQWYVRRDGELNIKPDALPDYYLVLAGPKSGVATMRSLANPWIIESVFLFDAHKLNEVLRERNVKIGAATSVIGVLWDRAEIFPRQVNNLLLLSEEQRSLLALFR
jgi:hypothetical protein